MLQSDATRDPSDRPTRPSCQLDHPDTERLVTLRPLGSVIVPAHDEARVIGRCLDALFIGLEPGQLDVTVVCNGCGDDTAAVARSAGYDVHVIELAAASKAAALRAGDASATAFPGSISMPT